MRDILSDLEQGKGLSHENPMRRAQLQMQQPLPKRFYKEVSVGAADGGFNVLLDGRAVKTPGKGAVLLPSRAAAELVAAEYAAQGEKIDPATMPVTRLVNAALDGVAQDMAAVAADVVNYAGTDLLCYRADGPDRLVSRQNAAWNPVLEWMEREHGARMVLAEGVMHVAQPERSIAAVSNLVGGIGDPLRLAALHSMTTLTGSALLALAVVLGRSTADEAWAAAHVDEDWTVELWGEDAEATARRALRRAEMDAAARLVAALSSDR